MIQLMFETLVSNSLIAAIIAGFALLIRFKANWPALEHLLWVIVLVKLMTPSLWDIEIPVLAQPAMVTTDRVDQQSMLRSHEKQNLDRSANEPDFDPIISPHNTSLLLVPDASDRTTVATQIPADAPWFPWRATLLATWAIGSLLVLLRSSFRITAFHRLLQQSSSDATETDLRLAAQTSQQMELRSSPQIKMTSAKISPLVWWVGGRVQVFLPSALRNEMDDQTWRLVLAHEFAHVQRRDYFVRWLEWLAVCLFWWNPLVWIAQKNLRVAEESCCDGLVLRRLSANRRDYAETVLSVIENLANPSIRPPALASEINSGGMLERRIKMVLSNQTPSMIGNRFCFAFAILVFATLPIGFSLAISQTADESKRLPVAPATPISSVQSPKSAIPKPTPDAQPTASDSFGAIEKRLQAAVDSGEISVLQKQSMLHAFTHPNSQHRNDLAHAKHAFATSLAIMRASFSRAKDVAIECEHFRRLEDTGAKTLDVALDAQRRRFQADVDLDSALLQNSNHLNSFETEILKAIETGQLNRKEAHQIQLESEKQLWETKEILGEAYHFDAQKNAKWLAKRKVEHAVAARTAALQAWRTIKTQFESGTETNVQQVAQAAEQFHFFDVAVQSANNQVRLIEAVDSSN